MLVSRAGSQGTNWLAYVLLVSVLTGWFLTMPTARGSMNLLLNDPDNYQRLVQIRDWLGGQSWWDTTQYRIDPPDGLRLHWSRLADVPLAGLIVLLSAFVEFRTAEVLAVVALPPLLLLFTAVLMGRAARNVGGAPAETWARLLFICVPFVLVQFLPGRIDHHGLQLMLLAGALAAATAEPNLRTGLLVALSTSISLHVGLELVPLLLAIPGWMAINWLIDGRESETQLEGFLFGMAIFLPVFLVLTVPTSEWGRSTYDQVGRGHVLMILSGSFALLAGMRTLNESLGRRAIALACGFSVAALPLVAFHEVISPPYSAVDPMLQRLWIDAIAETTSAVEIAQEDPLRLIYYHLFPGLSLLAGGALYLTTGRSRRLLLVLLVSFPGFILSLWQLRAMTGATLTALLVASIVGGFLWQHRSRRHGIAYLALGILLLNGFIGPILYDLIAGKSDQASMGLDAEGEASSCEIQLAQAKLDRVPSGLVLNGIDIGGLILVHSNHSVLAAGNHRAVDSNRQAYEIFLSTPTEAREKLIRNNIDYVLVCRDHELRRLAKFAPSGLAGNLYSGRIPDWLAPVPHEGSDKILFYTIAQYNDLSEDPEPAGGPGD
jgi:hypothetical protein